MSVLVTTLQQIEDLAGAARKALEVFAGRPIDLGEATILDISTFLDSLEGGAREDKMRATMLGLAMGALYGECIVSALGGEWFFEEALPAIRFQHADAFRQDEASPAIRFKDAKVYPFTHVAKHIAGGASETILAKYAVLKSLVVAGG